MSDDKLFLIGVQKLLSLSGKFKRVSTRSPFEKKKSENSIGISLDPAPDGSPDDVHRLPPSAKDDIALEE